jgi:GNAT superfamily N-acetyltransferase
MVDVRPFARSDRDQLTKLVNAHISAVVPGWSVPASALLAQLEHDAGESIMEPWVIGRTTIVGIERQRLVAAAYLKRYGDDDRVSPHYRGAGEIVWMVCWPDQLDAGRAVVRAAIAWLEASRVGTQWADGCLPTTATYGVPDAWPHIASLYGSAGFSPDGGQTEVQLAGPLEAIEAPGPAPIDGLEAQRVVGPMGTSFEAMLNGEIVGLFEVEDDHTRGGSMMRLAGWADESNHWVQEGLRGRGIGTWLVRHGAAWLRLGGTSRLLVYLIDNEHLARGIQYYSRFGLQPINRTRRGWKRPAGGPGRV